ncbi:MAG: histidine kinase [Lachnospiraceae bacterium]|nr:histidine kinase [Lachnospiraceae bacterium]
MNILVACIGLIISVLGLIQVLFSRQIDKKIRNWLMLLFGFLVGYDSGNLLFFGIVGRPGYLIGILLRVATITELLFSGFLMLVLTGFLLYCANEKKVIRNKYFILASLIGVLYLAIIVITQFNHMIYYFDSQNQFHRGALYVVHLIPPQLIMIWNLVVLNIKRNKLSSKQRFAFVLFFILPMICIGLQILFHGVAFIVLGTSVATFFLFVYTLMDQTERYYKRETENALLKIDILLAQIQPHFLFNTLTTIKYICKSNPDIAAEAIEKFTMYLRHNMDSITMDRPIPFEEELKHVNLYVELQKLRFGDELNINYELECTDFKIPTLTLQPLVENAISYGIRKNENGTGKVLVQSKKYEDRIEIRIIDNGPGFVESEVKNKKDRSHTGLMNVKERIELVVGGKLIINSEINKGTTVSIILPRED